MEGDRGSDRATQGHEQGAIRGAVELAHAVELFNVEHNQVGLEADLEVTVRGDGGGRPHGGGVSLDGDDAGIHRARHVALAALLEGEPQPRDVDPPCCVRRDQHHGNAVHAAAGAHADTLYPFLGRGVDALAERAVADAAHRLGGQGPPADEGK